MFCEILVYGFTKLENKAEKARYIDAQWVKLQMQSWQDLDVPY